MAEVVEINIICNDELELDILREFIHMEIGDYRGCVSIEAMDNWKYDNAIKIDLEEVSNYFHRNKIICITEKVDDGVIGINIERFKNSIVYTIWFNQKKYDILSHYTNLIKQFFLFFKNNIKSHFLLCAIGKEVIFEFQNDYQNLFRKSHGIDIWINLDIEFTYSIMKKYEKVNWGNYIILRNRNLGISLDMENI